MARKMRLWARLIAAIGIIDPLVTADLVWRKGPSPFFDIHLMGGGSSVIVMLFFSDVWRTSRSATCVATKTKGHTSKIIKKRICNISCFTQ